MFGPYIRGKIDEILARQMEVRRTDLPSGYHPASAIRNACRRAVSVPWQGVPVTVLLRTLGAGETPEVDLIKIGGEVKAGDRQAKNDWINIASDVTRKALVSPSYDEILEIYFAENPEIKEGHESFRRLEREYTLLAAERKTKLENMGAVIGAKRWDEFCALSERYDCMLPPDFISSIAAWVFCADATDASAVTEEQLAEAYALARHYRRDPADYIPGVFIERTRREINVKALMAWEKKHPPKKGLKKGGNNGR